MPKENKAINGKGGEGSPGEGAGALESTLKELIDGMSTVKGVVGDLATKVSVMEQSQQENQELEAVLRTMNVGEEKGKSTPPIKPVAVAGQVDFEKMSKGELVQYIMQATSGVDKSRIDALEAKLESGIGSLQVEQIKSKDEDFESKIRPISFKLSKQYPNMSIPEVYEIGKAKYLASQHSDLLKKSEDAETKIKELELKVKDGEKPGFFTGSGDGNEAEKMDPDEAFEKAWADSFGKQGSPE